MATRATYQITNWQDITVTYYCHYDGYLEGAAQYFFNMIKAKSKRDDYISRFIIGNPDHAEFTESHEVHGDTEFRYDLSKDGKLTIHERSGSQWAILFETSIGEFINDFLPKLLKDEYKPDEHKLFPRSIENYYNMKLTQWTTCIDLIKEGEELWLKAISFDESNPNYAHYAKKAKEALNTAAKWSTEL